MESTNTYWQAAAYISRRVMQGVDYYYPTDSTIKAEHEINAGYGMEEMVHGLHYILHYTNSESVLSSIYPWDGHL